MPIRKHGSGEITEASAEDRGLRKQAAHDFTDADRQELADENAKADSEEKDE